MEWYVQYETRHFTTWEALWIVFLNHFRQEKTPVQLLQKLYTLKPEWKEPVVEYVERLWMLYNYLDATSKPSHAMLVGGL